MNTTFVVIAVVIALLCLGYFTTTQTYVFSAVKMQLIRNGEPLKNVEVMRRYEWNSLKEDRTVTDDLGFFSFPSIVKHPVTRLLPVEIVIAQGLYAVIDGEEVKFWSNSKRNPKENDEFFNRTLNRQVTLTCDLADEDKLTREFGSITNTRCTFK